MGFVVIVGVGSRSLVERCWFLSIFEPGFRPREFGIHDAMALSARHFVSLALRRHVCGPKGWRTSLAHLIGSIRRLSFACIFPYFENGWR